MFVFSKFRALQSFPGFWVCILINLYGYFRNSCTKFVNKKRGCFETIKYFLDFSGSQIVQISILGTKNNLNDYLYNFKSAQFFLKKHVELYKIHHFAIYQKIITYPAKTLKFTKNAQILKVFRKNGNTFFFHFVPF